MYSKEASLEENLRFGVEFIYEAHWQRGSKKMRPPIVDLPGYGSFAFDTRRNQIKYDSELLQYIDANYADDEQVIDKKKRILGTKHEFALLTGVEEGDHSWLGDLGVGLNQHMVSDVVYDSQDHEYHGLGWQIWAAKKLNFSQEVRDALMARLKAAIKYRADRQPLKKRAKKLIRKLRRKIFG